MPPRFCVAHPSTGDPSWAVERGVPTSRGHSAVQADSVASGSPARLRACRACSWRPRWPRSYQYASRLYQIARFCSDPPPAPPPGSVAQSPAQLCRRRFARPMEADPRAFASHGCVFRGPRMRVKGEKCGQTCTVRSFFFRRPSGPSAVGSDVDQRGGTDPTSGRKHVRAIRKPFGVSRPKRGLKDITRGTQTPRRPRGVCLEPSTCSPPAQS
jgi:hypothetical protein